MPDHEPACTGTKRCSRCGEEKAVLAFATNRGMLDGLQPHCRDCSRLAAVKRYAEQKQRTAEKGWTMSHHRKPPA